MSDIDSLVSACYKNDVKTVRELVTMVDINQRSSEGEPPLYKAMRYNNQEIVKILLARPEIQLNTTDRLYSWTGLHAACFCNNVQCVQMFLASHHCTKDMVRLQDRNGKTAEMVATQARNQECARLVSDYLATPVQERVHYRVYRDNIEPARLTLPQLSDAIEKIEADEAALENESSAEIARLEEQLEQYKIRSASDLAYLQNRKQNLKSEFHRRAQSENQDANEPSAPPSYQSLYGE